MHVETVAKGDVFRTLHVEFADPPPVCNLQFTFTNCHDALVCVCVYVCMIKKTISEISVEGNSLHKCVVYYPGTQHTCLINNKDIK